MLRVNIYYQSWGFSLKKYYLLIMTGSDSLVVSCLDNKAQSLVHPQKPPAPHGHAHCSSLVCKLGKVAADS